MAAGRDSFQHQPPFALAGHPFGNVVEIKLRAVRLRLHAHGSGARESRRGNCPRMERDVLQRDAPRLLEEPIVGRRVPFHFLDLDAIDDAILGGSNNVKGPRYAVHHAVIREFVDGTVAQHLAKDPALVRIDVPRDP